MQLEMLGQIARKVAQGRNTGLTGVEASEEEPVTFVMDLSIVSFTFISLVLLSETLGISPPLP